MDLTKGKPGARQNHAGQQYANSHAVGGFDDAPENGLVISAETEVGLITRHVTIHPIHHSVPFDSWYWIHESILYEVFFLLKKILNPKQNKFPILYQFKG